MKYRAVLLGLFLPLSAMGLELGWSFNRTNGIFQFSYPAVQDRFYSLVRYDLVEDYFDQPHMFECGTNTTVVFDLDPNITGPDLNPSPSGLYWFYLAELSFPEGGSPLLMSYQAATVASRVLKASPRPTPPNWSPVALPAYLHPTNVFR